MSSKLSWSIVLLVFVGCETFREPKFNRPYGVRDGTVLVIPFREPARRLWYGESVRGEFLAGSFVAWARTNANPNFAEGRAVDDLQRTVRDWQGDEIRLEDWVRLTAPLGVKYVLAGEIEKLALSDPGVVGVLDASVTLSYKVLDVAAGKTAWERKNYVVRLAKRREFDPPVLDLGSDRKEVEERLLARAGSEIGKDLYGYKVGPGYNEQEE